MASITTFAGEARIASRAVINPWIIAYHGHDRNLSRRQALTTSLRLLRRED
jgi:hypothetical protein